MKNISTLSFVMLRMLLAYASRRGVDLQDICRLKGLEPAPADDSSMRVSAGAFHAVWQAAVARCEDIDFGLHFGESMQDLSGSHILFLVMMNCPNVKSALEAFCRYHNLVNDSIRPKIAPFDDGALLCLDESRSSITAGRNETEAFLCILNSVFRRVTGSACSPVRVMFRHAEPGDITEHRRIFQAPLMFGQQVSAIVLDKRHLEIPLNLADSKLLKFLEAYACSLLYRIYPPDTWADRVIESIRHKLNGQRPSLKEAARDLAVSARSLQNKLKEEGTTFQDLLDHVRKETAISLLKDPNISLYDVSFLLGFSEQSSFNHAFRRWTGSSPKLYRKNGPAG